ncbi:MAG: UbiH/UbiF family hydroxylase [Bauldia sp.]|nr:UbiH/UbiF family hydroxylase [Bauldia sp.]
MPPPPDCVDIAVVGGGLAGLLAALTLARAGRSVALFAPARPADERTTALLGDSVAALREAGLWPALADVAAPLRAIRIIDATRRLIRAPEVLFHADELGLEAFGYNIANRSLLGAMDAAVAAAPIRRIAAPVERLAYRRDDTVALVAASGEEVAARLVVAADGRGSATRGFAGIGFERRDLPQAALVGDFAHARPHDDISTEFHTEHGPFTLVPMLGQRSALVWVNEPDEARRLAGLPPPALAEAVETRASSILGAMTLEGAAQVFPLAAAQAERYGGRRVVLIGEAAHVVPPIAAQGFNLTVGDIRALADLATAADDPGGAEVTDGYDAARRGAVQLRASAVQLLNRSLLSSLLPAQGLRGLGLFALDRITWLRRLVMREGLGSATPTGTDRPAPPLL